MSRTGSTSPSTWMTSASSKAPDQAPQSDPPFLCRSQMRSPQMPPQATSSPPVKKPCVRRPRAPRLTDDLEDSIDGPDVTEEVVAESSTACGSLRESGDVDAGEERGDLVVRLVDLAKFLKALVRDGDAGLLGLDRGAVNQRLAMRGGAGRSEGALCMTRGQFPAFKQTQSWGAVQGKLATFPRSAGWHKPCTKATGERESGRAEGQRSAPSSPLLRRDRLPRNVPHLEMALKSLCIELRSAPRLRRRRNGVRGRWGAHELLPTFGTPTNPIWRLFDGRPRRIFFSATADSASGRGGSAQRARVAGRGTRSWEASRVEFLGLRRSG